MKTHSGSLRQFFGGSKSYIWWAIVLTTAVIHLLLSLIPSLAEHFYGANIWPLWRGLCSALLVPLPFNLLYFILFALLIWFIWIIKNTISRRSVFYLFRHILYLITALYVGFQWCWGFNYQRPGIEERMEWKSDRIPVDSVKADLLLWTDQLVQERHSLRDTTYPEHALKWKQSLNAALKQKVLPELDYRINRQLSVRQLIPAGILLRIGTAGFYLPYTGEGQIDIGLHPLQKPFTMAHEMGHAAGITGEGDCNFVGMLACLHASDPFVRYSGRLAMWQYLASEVKRTDPDWYQSYYREMDSLILQDIHSIRLQMQQYPDLFPKMRDRIYDGYLRAQGVEGGMANYDIVVRLLHRALRDEPGLLGNE